MGNEGILDTYLDMISLSLDLFRQCKMVWQRIVILSEENKCVSTITIITSLQSIDRVIP